MIVNSVLIFILGTFIGSFLGVLIDRLPKNKSILGRSYCDYCKRTLSPFDLIPIFSYFVLRGKCRYCRRKISPFYPLIELITGVLFAAAFLNIGGNSPFGFAQGKQFEIALIYYLIIVSSLIVVFFADLKYGIIPDKILAILILSSGIYLVFSPSLINHLLSALISFAFFLLLFIITKGRGMGQGDVKLSLILGLILGFPNFILALYLAFLTGSAISIILILWGKKNLRGDTISFGPFMVLGIFLTLFFSKEIMPLLLPFFVE